MRTMTWDPALVDWRWYEEDEAKPISDFFPKVSAPRGGISYKEWAAHRGSPRWRICAERK